MFNGRRTAGASSITRDRKEHHSDPCRRDWRSALSGVGGILRGSYWLPGWRWVRHATKPAIKVLSRGTAARLVGAKVSWIVSRLFSDRGWIRGLDFEVGENRG